MKMTIPAKTRAESKDQGLIDVVFSWSMADILKKDLYRDKVGVIPKTFPSTSSYMKSFIDPLIEETHADLMSKMTTLYGAPTCEVFGVRTSIGYKPPKNLLYNVSLKRIKDGEGNKGIYEPMVGDLIALSNVRPKCSDDLKRPEASHLFALVQGSNRQGSGILRILSSRPIMLEKEGTGKDKKWGNLFAVHITNLTTNIRIWNALSTKLEGGNLNMIKTVLQPNSDFDANCNQCSSRGPKGAMASKIREVICSSKLDISQASSVLSCIATSACRHENSVKLIWGPPGTGKTKTVASLLFGLLKMKCRTLTCAPTNIAVLEVTSRLVSLVTNSLENDTYGLGDIVLLINGERMKIDDNEVLLDVYLNYRVDVLVDCLNEFSGWRRSIESMICLLDNPEEQYQLYLSKEREENVNQDRDGETTEDEGNDNPSDNQCMEKRRVWKRSNAQKLRENKNNKKKMKEKKLSQKENQKKGDKKDAAASGTQKKEKVLDGGSVNENVLTFKEFVVKRFHSIGKRLKYCITNLYTHLPSSSIAVDVVKNMIRAVGLLQAVGTLMLNVPAAAEGFRKILNGKKCHTEFHKTKIECLQILRTLRKTLSVPKISGDSKVQSFCLKNACLVFCTASSSVKLQKKGMTPLDLLVIDEAAQLRECESAIPLQLSGLRHAVLIGDERQLPAMVQSEICEKTGFGRSLFERLVLLGHERHLLNVQYRMHPSISLFPNKEFYDQNISDGPNVKERTYQRHLLKGNMYGSYSFINVSNGKEEFDNSHSTKNMVEVAVVAEIVAMLFKESVAKKQKLSVGCISPYKAQVCFSEQFMESMTRFKKSDVHEAVISLLVKLSSGWRLPQKNGTSHPGGKAKTYHVTLEQYNVNGTLNLIWTVDILTENSEYTQVLKVWDILPASKIPNLAKSLSVLFEKYTVEIINHCNDKRFEGNSVVPMTWPVDSNTISYPTCVDADSSRSLASEFAALSLRKEAGSSSAGSSLLL
ncbi:hypothetical protein RJ640_009619, partial [Escallonia rubra]